jgi:hypothetical protein
MVLRRLVVAALLVTGAMSLPATAGPTAAVTPRPLDPLLRELASDPALPPVTHRAAVRAMAAGAGSGEDFALADAGVVDDLDGDGSQDVLTDALDQTQTPSGSWHEAATIGVLSGTTGRPVWSEDVGVTDGGTIPVPVRLGAASPGVLLLTVHLDTGTVEIRALTGTGRLLWHATPQAPQPATSGVWVNGLLRARHGASQLLVSWFTGAESGWGVPPLGANVSAEVLQLGLLDLRTGRVRAIGSGMPTAADAPHVFAVSDLDGDGTDDALVTAAVPQDGQALAVSTGSGSVLWRTGGLDLGYYAYVEGSGADAVGSHRGDLLLRSAVWTASTGRPAGQTCLVLDGETGAASPRVSLPSYAGCLFGGHRDVVLWQVGTAERGGTLDVRAWLPARDGTTWSRHVVLPGTVVRPEDVALEQLQEYGDVQPDGAQELGYHLLNERSGREAEAVLDGGTGAARFGSGLRPLGSLDGRGDDLLRVAGEFQLVRTLTTVEGRTGRIGGSYRVTTRYGAVIVDTALLRGRGACSRGLLLVASSLSDAGPVAHHVQLVDLGSGRTRWARDLSGAVARPFPVARTGREIACG